MSHVNIWKRVKRNLNTAPKSVKLLDGLDRAEDELATGLVS